MEKQDYDKFAQLEKQYHEQGTCPEFENTQCPKQFKKQIPDLTEKEWETIGDDLNKLREVLENKENRAKLSALDTLEK